MKLIINASSLSSTGVVQVAVSFIHECINFKENEYMVLMSPLVSSQIEQVTFPSNFSFRTIPVNPNLFIKGNSTRRYLKTIEKEWTPNCVFSVFGPSYWSPSVPHLSGYAYPHYVYPESPFFKNISFCQRLKVKLYKTIHRWYLDKNGEYFVCETVDVSQRLTKYLGFNSRKVFTVSNTYNKYFNDFIPHNKAQLLPPKSINEFRFLSLCSLAPHKNLEILNEVIPLLNDSNLKIKFVLTIDESQFQKSFSDNAKRSIINVGRIDVSKCPQLYYETDALFLPTLLECFTANYPEAMSMGKPILTSNLSFATSICKGAALYFEPLDANDIKEKINMLVSSSELRAQLKKEGEQLILKIPSAAMRTEQYLNICKNISSQLTNQK